MEEAAIRRKLLIDGEGIGDDRRFSNMLKVLNRITELAETVAESKTMKTEEGEDPISQMTAEAKKFEMALQLSTFTMKKASLIHQTNACEQERYQELSKKIEEQVRSTHVTIEECKRELEEAKQIRRHRQEYDNLATIINQQPDRRETQRKISEIEKNMEECLRRKAEVEAKTELRKKNFHVLVVALSDVQEALAEEEMEEERAMRATDSADLSTAPSPTSQNMESD